MKSVLKRTILILLTLATLLPSSAFAAAPPNNPQANTKSELEVAVLPEKNKTVILILAPYLTWSDISLERTPNLWEAAREGGVGDINARSRAKDEAGEPSIVEGALTLSAGAWAKIDRSAFSAYNVHEFFERGDAGSAYTRMVGEALNDEEIVYLGLPRTQAANASNSFSFYPGLLGSTIRKAGGLTVAFGNSDLGYLDEAERIMRPAALVAMDLKGRVMRGEISEQMLERNAESPYGVRSDLKVLTEKLQGLRSEVASHKTNLIVLDPGDLYRARSYAVYLSPAVSDAHWLDALKTLDETFKIAQENYPNASVIVSAQAARAPGARLEGFGPLIITNTSEGLLTSNSTQRAGLVTNLDLSATILDILSLDQPVEMIGQKISSTTDFSTKLVGKAANTPDARLDLLKKMNATALSVELNRAPVLNTFIFSIVFILAAGAFVVIRSSHWSVAANKIVRRILKIGIIAVLSFPAASWLMFLVYRWPATQQQALNQFIGVLLAIIALNIALTWKFKGGVALIFLSVATSLVIIIDQLLGAPASFTSFFGYSPIQAFRFYGIGNEGAAVLFGAAVIGIVLTLDYWRDAHWIVPFKRYGVLLIGFLVTFVSAAPNLGANVGVALWGTVGFMGLHFLVNGKKITAGRVVIIALVVIVMLGSIVAIDRFSSNETHLARSISASQEGGIERFYEIVVRKVETNLRVLTATNLVFLLIAVIGFLALMRWRPTGDFKETLADNPYFSHGMTCILITGVVAYFSEDSGIVLPALMVLYLGNSIVWLMLDTIAEPNLSLSEGER